jgi:hypothetical protein
MQIYLGGPECCSGLTAIGNYQIDETGCHLLLGGQVCAYCPNGECGAGENYCNCPSDCCAALFESCSTASCCDPYECIDFLGSSFCWF